MELWELIVRESVRHTISAYNVAGDRGDLEGLAAAFTPGGVLRLDDRPPFEGRHAIVTGLAGVLDDPRSADDDRPPLTYVHHMVASTHFHAVSPTEASVQSYFLVITAVGVDHWGRYHDRFVPHDDRWLLADRRARLAGAAPTSLFPAT